MSTYHSFGTLHAPISSLYLLRSGCAFRIVAYSTSFSKRLIWKEILVSLETVATCGCLAKFSVLDGDVNQLPNIVARCARSTYDNRIDVEMYRRFFLSHHIPVVFHNNTTLLLLVGVVVVSYPCFLVVPFMAMFLSHALCITWLQRLTFTNTGGLKAVLVYTGALLAATYAVQFDLLQENMPDLSYVGLVEMVNASTVSEAHYDLTVQWYTCVYIIDLCLVLVLLVRKLSYGESHTIYPNLHTTNPHCTTEYEGMVCSDSSHARVLHLTSRHLLSYCVYAK